MPRWMKPTEEVPDEVEVGDRVCIIVVETMPGRKKPSPRLVILEATEDGWESMDDVYAGYTPQDGVLWSTEKDICQIAGALTDAI